MLSLFSGIGSPETALKRLAVEVDLYGFSEIDKYAIKSYCTIHGVSEDRNLGDITKINIEALPKDIELVTHGSPCQDYSTAGKGNGGDMGTGTRSSLMWNTVAICEYCQPKYVIWENVKNVISKKHIHNFEKYLAEMGRIGYRNYYKVLNAKDYGVPQNRERVFVVSIRNDVDKEFKFPVGFDNGVRLKDVLEQTVDEKYYINQEKTNQLIKNLDGKIDLSKQVVGTCHEKNDLSFATRDMVYSEEKNAPTLSATMYKDAPKVCRACITPDRVNKRQNGRRFKEDGEPMFTITSQDRHGILQVGLLDIKGNEQLRRVYNTDGISPCLNTMQGGNTQPKIMEEAPPMFKVKRAVVQGYTMRKLTPLECWRLMGFKDEEFKRAEEVCSNSQLYKQAGNSIVVNVMEEIFKELI